ncbi:helix-turn-helix domain-containing protein [Saccharopolyspora sp. NPDC000995]
MGSAGEEFADFGVAVSDCAGMRDGLSNVDVAGQLRVARPTVGKRRSRFVQRRLEGLADEDRPGAPRKITDEQVEKVVVSTLEEKPNNATHWSRASIAKRLPLGDQVNAI